MEKEMERLLYDGENYYLIRSLNKKDIETHDRGEGIYPKLYEQGEILIKDILEHSSAFANKRSKFISMTSDPNVVLTYDRENLHRFVLVKVDREEIIKNNTMFSAGNYLLDGMEQRVEELLLNAPEEVKGIIDRVDQATTIEEIREIINGADSKLKTSLIDKEQQYLEPQEQLKQAKSIAKCKVLNYYGIMQNIEETLPRMGTVEKYTSVMRVAYHNLEWLTTEKIEEEKITNIPRILVDALALIRQAEFQGKDIEQLRTLEQDIIKISTEGAEIVKNITEYTAHEELRQDLTIDKAYEMTRGTISYRDTNMQITAIRSIAEITLYKRTIIDLLQQRNPNINVEELLEDTYCINNEMITRRNEKGVQIGKNVNFEISAYGYSFDDETSMKILQKVSSLTDEELINIITKGVEAEEIQDLLIETREKDERIQYDKQKKASSKYTAEAIVEGYNWKKCSNAISESEKEQVLNELLKPTILTRGQGEELYNLYEAINKIQIGKNKFTQDEVFAIIINIAIDKKIGDITYSKLLEKNRQEIQLILLENSKRLQTTVLPISIDLLAGRGKEIEKLKQELIEMGIDREFIETKNIKNVYMAKQIVEEYEFERELSQEEKVALIKNILLNSQLDKKSGIYLSILIENMRKIGLEEQEIYGMIINLGVNGSVIKEAGYGYTYLLGNRHNACVTIEQYKDEIQTKVTEGMIAKAKVKSKRVEELENIDLEEETIKAELEELGLERGFIETKDIKNVYVARKIVEEYEFGRELSQEEKVALIKNMLANSGLDKKSTYYLSTLIENMIQIGLEEQDIYGMIINLGVNENVIKEAGYAYDALLRNVHNACVTIGQYKDEIETEVTEKTIAKAKIKAKREEEWEKINLEEEKIKKELEELGIDREFIEIKDIKNVYVARKIVEEYEFGRELETEEKVALIKNILGNSNLDKGMYLSTLIENMKKIGLEEQEIYGMIINLGVNGNVIKEAGYGYNRLLHNAQNACVTIGRYKDEIQTEVTEETIKKAKIKVKRMEEWKRIYSEEEKIKIKLEKLGIDREFIETKDIRNLYVAREIVEEYEFGRELSTEEKVALIKNILSSSDLDKKNHGSFLSTLIENMRKIGLEEQEIYGMIINLGVNGSVIKKGGYGYNKLLVNKQNACETIGQYKDEIQTEVTEETIAKAVKKANKPKKIKSSDIGKATAELMIEGSGGYTLCSRVYEDYNKLRQSKEKEDGIHK